MIDLYVKFPESWTQIYAKGRLLKNKARPSGFFPTYHLYMIYPTVKFHESIQYNSGVMTQIKIFAKGK